MVATLIGKLSSSKQKLSLLRAMLDDKNRDSMKKGIEENKKKGEKIIAEFVKSELDKMTDINRKEI